MAYKDLIVFFNRKIKLGKVDLNLVHNIVIDNQAYVHFNISWKHLVHKCTPKMVTFYIQLKKDFTNRKFEYEKG